jgi:four helix bundle protein
MRDFTKLEMWQLGMDIAVEVTDILEAIPMTKAGFKIRDQADDAACSIASNIAEGSSRRSEKEKYRYFEYALGSAFELQTRMLILQRRKYADEALVNGFLEKVVTVQKKIGAFMGVLSA